MKIQVKLANLNQLQELVKDIERKHARKALKAGINEAASLVLRQVRANVPVDTKALRQAIGKKVKVYRNGGNVVAIIGARKDAPNKPPKYRKSRRRRRYLKSKIVNPKTYVHIVEFGSRPHAIGKKDSLRKKRQTGRLHPGSVAKPFMRPAWASSQEAAAAVVVRRVQQEINKLRFQGKVK